MRPPSSSATVAFSSPGGSQGVHLAGYWEFPGGKCDAGETLAACLTRELREELDVDVAVGDELFTTTHAYPERRVELHFSAASCWAIRRRSSGRRCDGRRAKKLERSEVSAADAELIRLLSEQD